MTAPRPSATLASTLRRDLPIDRRRAPAKPRGWRERRLSDRLHFVGLMLRWVAAIVGAAVAFALDTDHRALVTVAVVLVMTACVRVTMTHVGRAPDTSRRATINLLIDFVLLSAAVLCTNGWESPFLFVLLAPIFTVSMHRGRSGALLGIAWAIVVACMGTALQLDYPIEDAQALTDQVLVVMPIVMVTASVITAIVGVRMHLILVRNARMFQSANDDQTRIAAANNLLTALHTVTQAMSTPLDVSEVSVVAREQCRRFNADTAVLVTHDSTTNQWTTAFQDGVRLGEHHLPHELPSLVATSMTTPDVMVEHDLVANNRRGWNASSASGMAIALRARDHVVGVLSIEYSEQHTIDRSDIMWLAGLGSNLALAIDNAQWLARLRSLGAETERNRLARDLHDRLAQTLAYVAIELERLDAGQHGELGNLCALVREVVGELRSTLYELRTAPTDDRDLVGLLEEYSGRFTERCNVPVTIALPDNYERFPRTVELEFWRIIQEALTNVERHARAERAWVTIFDEPDRYGVEIRDDGQGFDNGERDGHYGVTGMRERADAINATFLMETAPGAGTRIRVEVEVPH